MCEYLELSWMSWPLALGTVKGRVMASNSSAVASLSRMYIRPGMKSLSTWVEQIRSPLHTWTRPLRPSSSVIWCTQCIHLFVCACVPATQFPWAPPWSTTVLCWIHFPSNLSNVSRAKLQDKRSFVRGKGFFPHGFPPWEGLEAHDHSMRGAIPQTKAEVEGHDLCCRYEFRWYLHIY